MPVATLVGLTGGIGSGKSTVAQMLSSHGAVVIDADAIARSVTAPGGTAIDAIAAHFGTSFITPEGALDRERMRSLVFAQPDAKKQLEAIIHPLVGQETDRHAQLAVAQGHRCIVFDVPLLVESGFRWRGKVHRVLVVDCQVETQIARVMARNGLAHDEVDRIIAAQASRVQRLAAADMVIYNEDLSMVRLNDEVTQIAHLFGL
jgi:dephospho-CoA kinase